MLISERLLTAGLTVGLGEDVAAALGHRKARMRQGTRHTQPGAHALHAALLSIWRGRLHGRQHPWIRAIEDRCLHSEAGHGAHARCGCCALHAVRCLRARRTIPVCSAFSSKPARRRRRPISIHSVRAPPCASFPLASQVVPEGVGPERSDKGAELHGLALQAAAAISKDKPRAHQVQLLATFCERVRALVSLVAEF